MIGKSVLIWLSIIPLAILNGTLREKVLVPLMGLNYAKPISGMTLCLLIFIVSLIFIPRLGKGSKNTYWTMGITWLILTVLFEAFMGLALGNSIKEIIKAYDITTGNLWLIVVLFVGIVPVLIAKLRQIV